MTESGGAMTRRVDLDLATRKPENPGLRDDFGLAW